jgi:hypothetical protein
MTQRIVWFIVFLYVFLSTFSWRNVKRQHNRQTDQITSASLCVWTRQNRVILSSSVSTIFYHNWLVHERFYNFRPILSWNTVGCWFDMYVLKWYNIQCGAASHTNPPSTSQFQPTFLNLHSSQHFLLFHNDAHNYKITGILKQLKFR